jgi:hypothetical protein
MWPNGRTRLFFAFRKLKIKIIGQRYFKNCRFYYVPAILILALGEVLMKEGFRVA